MAPCLPGAALGGTGGARQFARAAARARWGAGAGGAGRREYLRLTTGQDLSPGQSSAFWAAGARVRLEAQVGRVAAAESALVAGEAAGWHDDGAQIQRALVLALQGEHAATAAARAGVSPAALAAHPAWADVDRVVGRLLARP